MVLFPREGNIVVSVALTFQHSKLLLLIWHLKRCYLFRDVICLEISEDFSTDAETQTEITIIDREREIGISVCLFCIWQLWMLSFILSIAKGVSHSVACLSFSYSRRKREKYIVILEIQKPTQGFWIVAKTWDCFPWVFFCSFFEREFPHLFLLCAL